MFYFAEVKSFAGQFPESMEKGFLFHHCPHFVDDRIKHFFYSSQAVEQTKLECSLVERLCGSLEYSQKFEKSCQGQITNTLAYFAPP